MGRRAMTSSNPNTHPGAWLDRPWVAMLLLVHPDGASPAVIGFRGYYVL